jgi:hypothetical protein
VLFALTMGLSSPAELERTQAELRLMRGAARAHGAGVAGRSVQEAEPALGEMAMASPAQPTVSGAVESEDFAKWERAFPPMGS